ncbi:lantibiotic dehydratase family protein [Solirubrobacter ginsenosidimutans]|uniref:Lantibiotic dehydratase family protein n=1 Tax=Solirubrobacter ginsenosidimutans TaxID=490573 RepID=A0A9X3MQU5_9ACTN|nr:lantibiotic dehydratase [Solirubrobacter ginsenosidimutans]MDA0160117.1 lantibiotic dehydratase family protein [Solirubrobacter ginsenosidimutans]
MELTREWDLWPEFAVRSSGFPVEGLDVFGPGEEQRLARVARDPAFREAVAWQSRESLTRAVDKLAAGAPGSPSKQRRWTDVVAGYWQRYCAKNDTIGFFGPLAWGSFAADGAPIAVRAGTLERERVVHFETWAMEALAFSSGVHAPLPMGPFPERALRPLLHDTSALDRLERTREDVGNAPREHVAAALDQLDAVFEQVTGRAAAHATGDSGGGRTIAYLDSMRDLDLTLGPAVIDELRSSLPIVLAASRWWCGRVFDRGTELLERIAHGHEGPLAPLLGRLMGAGFGLWDQMGEEQEELRRRWASAVNGDAAAFADWTPAWYASDYHSADLQIAAQSPDAIARGDFLVVLGDFHGGDNPLAQGLFGLRHPDPAGMLRRIAAEAGPGVHLSPPRRGVVEMTARSWPLYPEGDVVVTSGDEPAPPGTHRVALDDVVIDGDGHVRDRQGTFRTPLARFLYLPIFVAALRSFDPIGEHEGRAQLGKLVVRREHWSAPANELPTGAPELAAWARDRGLPRRVFARSPLERKPRYVDFKSASLTRTLARFVAPAREQAPGAPFEFTEMLPGPQDCWLRSDAGRHTCELRVVARAR